MALKISDALKVSQLQAVALQCGISPVGPKASLVKRLVDAISPPGRRAKDRHPKEVQSNGSARGFSTGLKPTRVLSIDMGIRNFAFCILELPSATKKPTTSLVPNVIAWRRLVLSKAPEALDTDGAGPVDPALAKKELRSQEAESFQPPNLSSIAYNLLRTQLLPHQPTHILIERQRFRSMGGSHIQEWTLRVNMLEAILYAILHTLRQEGHWDGEVIPIVPKNVGTFWVGDEKKQTAALLASDETPLGTRSKAKMTRLTKLKNKTAKIDLVKQWIENKDQLDFGSEEAELTSRAYLEKWYGRRGKGEGKAKSQREDDVQKELAGMTKLDDLADSLLQGMAWIEWERNKQLVREQGVDSMIPSS